MKICFLSYWSCPLGKIGVLSNGGANIYLLNFAKWLGVLSHDVDIYTPIHKGLHDPVSFLKPNVRVIHLHKLGKDRFTDAGFFADSVYSYIKNKRHKYDIIHSHYYYSGLSGLELRKKIKIPHVTTFHTLGIMKKRYANITDVARIESEKRIVKETDAIIASTDLEKRDLLRDYKGEKEKIFVIPPGVDHELFKPYNKITSRRKLRLPEHKKIILFVGRIDPIKGISLLIDAVSLITKKYPIFEKKFRVLLIGGDITSRNFWQQEEVKRIKYLIGINNLDCCVKFLGSRPHEILPYFYSASDLVVLPSYYESFGLVVLEAMACGKAVIASKVGGLPYLIKDGINGRLFKSGSAPYLAEVLWKTICSERQQNLMGQKALEVSLKLSWAEQTKKLVRVYKKLI